MMILQADNEMRGQLSALGIMRCDEKHPPSLLLLEIRLLLSIGPNNPCRSTRASEGQMMKPEAAPESAFQRSLIRRTKLTDEKTALHTGCSPNVLRFSSGMMSVDEQALQPFEDGYEPLAHGF